MFLYPLLSGEARAEKRQKALVAPAADRRERIAAVSRKDPGGAEPEGAGGEAEGAGKLTLETRIAQAGLSWTKRGLFFLFSAAASVLLGAWCFSRRSSLSAAGAAFRGRHRPAAVGAGLSQEQAHQ